MTLGADRSILSHVIFNYRGFPIMKKLLSVFVGLIFVHASSASFASPPPNSFADLSEKLLPSVVNISSTQKAQSVDDMPQMQDFPEFPQGSPFQDFFDQFMDRRGGGGTPFEGRPPASMGSGFIIDAEKGYIITNNHVIGDADEVKVIFHDDDHVIVDIVGRDEKTDIAVLQVKTDKPLTAVQFGNSDTMRVGDWVVAIGNPFGLGGTVTAGIISARQRNIDAGPYDNFIQTDASINRGNSGGPMFNLNGDVIGINTAIFSPTGGSVGIGFAIPSTLAKPVIDQLIEYGKTRRGWLGVRIQTVSDEIADSLDLPKTMGAMVASVTPKGPAEKAGFKMGDIILSFDGKDIDEMRDLPLIVAQTDIGKKVDVVFWRGGKKHTVKVKVAELEKAEEDGLLDRTQTSKAPTPSDQSQDIELIGLTLGLYEDNVVITDLDQAGEAIDKGLAAGDIIREINQTTITSPKQAQDVIGKAKKVGKKSVLLLVEPQGRGETRFVALKLVDGE